MTGTFASGMFSVFDKLQHVSKAYVPVLLSGSILNYRNLLLKKKILALKNINL